MVLEDHFADYVEMQYVYHQFLFLNIFVCIFEILHVF